ncbi:MAG: TetR/AcrR family transcriptional regulator [Planctomycetales bacterium]|nr:TetR/AcrR family transcriptional regulator [Planctomycetales bacterium]
MRITAEEKQATRERIEAAALELFRTRGFEATTTRDIAKTADIAVGTLFNYFAAKEAIVIAMAEEGVVKAQTAIQKQTAAETLEENLFALVAAELRQLKPLRKFIGPVLETALSPLATAAVNGEAGLRVAHLESVARIARAHGVTEVSSVALQVYWSLYTGVLAFWAADNSPKQEETLALLDNSLHMFAAWLQDAPAEPR